MAVLSTITQSMNPHCVEFLTKRTKERKRKTTQDIADSVLLENLGEYGGSPYNFPEHESTLSWNITPQSGRVTNKFTDVIASRFG